MKTIFQPPTKAIPVRLLVKPLPGEGHFQWITLKDGVADSDVTGTLEQLSALQWSLPGSELILVLPAGEAALRTVSVNEAERKLFRQTLPYELEDSLSENTDKLHFSFTALSDDRMGVVLVRRARLQALLDEFRDAGLGIDCITPEILLLPYSSQQQTWLLQGREVVARMGTCAGFVASLDNLELVARLADGAGSEDGQSLLLVAEEGADIERATAAIAAIAPQVEVRTVASALAWQASVLPDSPFTLLQGDFKAPLRWREYWRFWKPAAAACVAVLLLNYAVLYYQYSEVKQRAERLQSKKYELARQAIPVGKISSPERQMRAALAQFSSSGPTRFGAMLVKVGPLLGGESGYSVRTINYDGGNNSLRLEVRTQDFQRIEQFRNLLQSSGLQAELLNSSAQSKGILARLELKEVGR